MRDETNHPINKIMEEALTKIKTLIDVNTVIGDPITTLDGLNIIPITKVSMGFVAGGGEYSQNIPPKKQKDEYPFAGGSGAGFTITPIGFLVGRENNLKLITVDNKNSFEEIVKIVSNIVKKVTNK